MIDKKLQTIPYLLFKKFICGLSNVVCEVQMPEGCTGFLEVFMFSSISNVSSIIETFHLVHPYVQRVFQDLVHHTYDLDCSTLQ